ncbi:hypothetical protein HDU81_000719 [Chytriomyces hyalinus]|nr:hypothetical protein HDU81_000719 [Chytriomyces hyalinus]
MQQQQQYLRQPTAQIQIHECTRQQQLQQSYTTPLYYTSLPSPPLPPTQLHPTLYQTKTPPSEYIVNKRSVCYVALPSTTTTATTTATKVLTTTRARLLKRRARSQQHQQLKQQQCSSLASTGAAQESPLFPRVFAKMPVSVAHVKQMSRAQCVTCFQSMTHGSCSACSAPACRAGAVGGCNVLDGTRPFVMSIQALILDD